jgi:hypothetical protein
MSGIWEHLLGVVALGVPLLPGKVIAFVDWTLLPSVIKDGITLDFILSLLSDAILYVDEVFPERSISSSEPMVLASSVPAIFRSTHVKLIFFS